MINPDQLREAIASVLASSPNNNLYSEEAIELLMLTAATESRMGTYIKQIKGPALGIFQMEPATEEDIWNNYLKYQPTLAGWVKSLKSTSGNNLKLNIEYQIAMARLHYWRKPSPLPSRDRVLLAGYWKENYNTHLGKGTIDKAVADYERYAL